MTTMRKIRQDELGGPEVLHVVEVPIPVTGMLVEPDRAGIEAVAALAADGRLKADVAQTFPLEEASRAHDLGERGAIGGGKLVLTPGS